MSRPFARTASLISRAAVAAVGSLGVSTSAHAITVSWDGLSSANSNWTSGANWVDPLGGHGSAPPNDGTADIVMRGNRRLDPLVDVDYDILSLQFGSTASPFVFQSGGQSLSIRGGGITNNAA